MAIELFPSSSIRFSELGILGNSSEEFSGLDSTGGLPFRMKYIGFSYSAFQTGGAYRIYFEYPLQESQTTIFVQGSVAKTTFAYARPFYHYVSYDSTSPLVFGTNPTKDADYPEYDSSLIYSSSSNSITSLSGTTLRLRLPLAGSGFYKIGGIAKIYEGTFPNV
jgi:hypothetical protein